MEPKKLTVLEFVSGFARLTISTIFEVTGTALESAGSAFSRISLRIMSNRDAWAFEERYRYTLDGNIDPNWCYECHNTKDEYCRDNHSFLNGSSFFSRDAKASWPNRPLAAILDEAEAADPELRALNEATARVLPDWWTCECGRHLPPSAVGCPRGCRLAPGRIETIPADPSICPHCGEPKQFCTRRRGPDVTVDVLRGQLRHADESLFRDIFGTRAGPLPRGIWYASTPGHEAPDWIWQRFLSAKRSREVSVSERDAIIAERMAETLPERRGRIAQQQATASAFLRAFGLHAQAEVAAADRITGRAR